MLKLFVEQALKPAFSQPPSGGCVLKHRLELLRAITIPGSHLRVAVC